MKKLFIFSSLFFFTNILFAQTIEKTEPESGNGTGGGIVPKLSDISDYKHTVISLGGSSNGILSKSTSSYSVIDIDAPTGLNSLLRLGKAGLGKWTVYNNGSAGNDNFGIYEYAVAERFTIAKTTGLVGIGVIAPAARLHVVGGVWDVATTEGDFKIGDATYRLKIGVATGGGGAGDARIFASGGTNRIIFGTGTTDQAALFGANFGIGTIAPTAKFHISHDTEADDTKPHIKLTQTGTGNNGRIRMENADGSTYFMQSFYPASGTPASDYIRWTHSGGGESLRLKGNGNATISGFTQLGSSAPAIKMKYLTTTSAATVSTGVDVAHGLAIDNIISVTAMVQYGGVGGNYVNDGNDFTNFKFDLDIRDTVIRVFNQPSSSSILSKPVRILITYIE
jgi:hypothetical protein